MIDENRADFVRMLTATAALYGRALSHDVISLYWGALAPYKLADVRQAFDRHVKNADAGRFMPLPANIIKMVAGSNVDSAREAWSKVERAVRRVGHQSVVFDDALIHRVVDDLGGWTSLGLKSSSEWPFVAKEFIARYSAFLDRNERPAYPPVLGGRYGLSDGLVFIGDAAAAARVQADGMNEHVQIAFAPQREPVARITQ